MAHVEFYVLLVFALAVYRVSRLVTIDKFPPIVLLRARIAGRWGDDSWQAYLSECPWCASVWVGGAGVLLAVWLADVTMPVAAWLASSALTGLLIKWEDPE